MVAEIKNNDSDNFTLSERTLNILALSILGDDARDMNVKVYNYVIKLFPEYNVRGALSFKLTQCSEEGDVDCEGEIYTGIISALNDMYQRININPEEWNMLSEEDDATGNNPCFKALKDRIDNLRTTALLRLKDEDYFPEFLEWIREDKEIESSDFVSVYRVSENDDVEVFFLLKGEISE